MHCVLSYPSFQKNRSRQTQSSCGRAFSRMITPVIADRVPFKVPARVYPTDHSSQLGARKRPLRRHHRLPRHTRLTLRTAQVNYTNSFASSSPPSVPSRPVSPCSTLCHSVPPVSARSSSWGESPSTGLRPHPTGPLLIQFGFGFRLEALLCMHRSTLHLRSKNSNEFVKPATTPPAQRRCHCSNGPVGFVATRAKCRPG
jgi:hypothetical protein